jgi:hypothetical protein
MPERTREESEEAVLEAVKEKLPDLGKRGTRIEIIALDPEENAGSHFVVGMDVPAIFACSRGSDRGSR